jgi:hypothetical protein
MLVVYNDKPIPVEAWVYGLSLTGNAGSNPDGDMDVCLL